MKATPVSVSAEDMQFLETRRFQIAEIARIYGVPLHMLNETEKTTSWGSGLEQMTQGFVTYSFGHWIRRWEQQRERKLLTRAERASGLYIRKSLQALMRGDSQQRAQFYKEMFAVGAFSANHILELEDMELLPDAVGGIHFRPANFIPLDQRSGQPAATETTA
jgi:HK97 family phage portal protein